MKFFEKLSVYLAIFLLTYNGVAAQPSLTFTENRGQWHEDFTHSYRSDAIEFYMQSSGWHVYILPPREIEHAGERYTTYSLPEGHETGIPEGSIYGISFQFVGTKNKQSPRGLLSSRAITNYFLGSDSTKWASEVRSFSSLSYCDLYEGVDLYLHRVAGRLLKYDWIVRPGGDLAQIRMRIKGAQKLSLRDDGALEISTPYGPLVERLPLVYQLKGKDTLRVPCRYLLSGDEIGFKVDEYDLSLPLIVDPELVAASYTGSSVDQRGVTATFDRLGDVYTGGFIHGTSTGIYKAHVGSIQPQNAGNSDMHISKFDARGSNLLYMTYIGGTGRETPSSTIVHPSGDLIVYGITASVDFPTTSAAFSRKFNDPSSNRFEIQGATPGTTTGTDICLVRLNSKATKLIASTYVGGSKLDGISTKGTKIISAGYGDAVRGEVIIDTDGHILVASWTQSADFPKSSRTSVGYHDRIDGVLFKMSEGLNSLIWSVFVGGVGDDLLNSLKATKKGYFVTGNTSSKTMGFPEKHDRDRHPSLQSTLHGRRNQVDGFVAFIDRETLNISRGTYLGTDKFDVVLLLDIGHSGNVHVVGQTLGDYEVQAPDDNPDDKEFYSNPGGKVFIHTLDSLLTKTLWATTIGASKRGRDGHPMAVPSRPNISPTSFRVNACGQIYLSGYGGDYSKTAYTFGLPLSFDLNSPDTKPMQSQTDGQDFYFMTLDSSALGDNPIYATYFGDPTSRDHVDGGTSRFDPYGVVYHAVCTRCEGNGPGGFPTTADAFSRQSLANRGNGCNLAFFKFQFSGISARLETNNEERSQPGFSVGCSPLTVAFIDKSKGAERSEWDLGDGKGFREIEEQEFLHTFEEAGTYEVVLRIFNSQICLGIRESRTLITVLDEPRAFSSDQSICEGESLRLYASGGISYTWEPPTGLSDSRVSNPVASPTESTTYRVTLRTPGGCVASKSIQVTVLPRLEASFDRLQRGNACLGNRSATFRARAVEATQITWHMGDGTSYQGEEIEHTYEASGNYTVRLEVSNEGCFAQASEVLQARDIFVTNAITPNGDGKNDQLILISESPLGLSIYDRNGAPVYENKAYTNQWTGDNLPGGVYFYNLKLPTDENCKGWIHLIRTEG